MFKTFTKLALASAIAVGAFSANASLLLDDFTVGFTPTALGDPANYIVDASGVVSQTGLGTSYGQAFDATGTKILGKYRSISIENLPAPPGFGTAAGGTTTAKVATNNIGAPVGSGSELSTGVASGDYARFTLTWDGDSDYTNTGLSLGADLSTYAGFEFWVKSDGGNPTVAGSQKVRIVIVDGLGNTATTQFDAINTSNGPTFNYFFAEFGFAGDFIVDPGFNWTNIGAVTSVIDVNGVTESLDFSLRAVNFVVPEPGSLALLGASLLAIGAVRRRKVQH